MKLVLLFLYVIVSVPAVLKWLMMLCENNERGLETYWNICLLLEDVLQASIFFSIWIIGKDYVSSYVQAKYKWNWTMFEYFTLPAEHPSIRLSMVLVLGIFLAWYLKTYWK